jgi:hypothetical protein
MFKGSVTIINVYWLLLSGYYQWYYIYCDAHINKYYNLAGLMHWVGECYPDY